MSLADMQILVPGGSLSTDDLRMVAEARTRIHSKDSSHRPLVDDHDLIGLLGQRRFSIESGLPMDLSIKRHGDGRVNFTTDGGTTINVSTYRNPVHLLREAGKSAADIHVLAGISESLNTVTLIGWEYDRIMVLCPVKTMRGYDIENHVMLADDLRPMDELYEILKEERENE